MKKAPEIIEGIKVTEKIKYLGITINNTRNCFKYQKRMMINKPQKLANVTHSVREVVISYLLE